MDLGDVRESDHARGWAHQVLGRVLAGRDAAASQVHLQEAARLGRSEKNRYLEANARLASMEAQLAAESTSEAAEGARSSLWELQK